jgi:hypothetical protein
MHYTKRTAKAIALGTLLLLSPHLAWAENCKSVKSTLLEDLPSKLEPHPAHVAILALNETRRATVSSQGRDFPGYECWGVANVWNDASAAPRTVRFIYQVFNVEIVAQGVPAAALVAGVSHICGEDNQRDDSRYAACSQH